MCSPIDADMAPFLTDWRGRFTGRALAVLRPATVDRWPRWCAPARQRRVPIVPQGGNTGLVLGSVPDASGTRRRAVAGAPEPHPRSSIPSTAP